MKKKAIFFKRLLSLMLSLFLIFPLLQNIPQNGGGLGWLFSAIAEGITATAPSTDDNSVYQIGTAEELYWFAQLVNSGETSAKAVLTADITVNSGDVAGCNGTKASDWLDWTPICSYSGTFDGQGHTVSGLYYYSADSESYSSVGLFGSVVSGGRVKNVGVINSYFYHPTAGGVCGVNGGTISGCYNTGTVSSSWYSGGVCGRNTGTVKNCYNTGSVGSSAWTGGICGQNRGTLSLCYNTGAVSATSDFFATAGGVCSDNTLGTIKNCYNTGTVSSAFNAGGVCAYNRSGDEGTAVLQNCYSIGTVSGSNYTGGVCGTNGKESIVTDCYFDSDRCTLGAVGSDRGTLTNVQGKTTVQFGNGHVCYLLAQCKNAASWGQEIGKDEFPVLNGKTVYVAKNCNGYSNTENYERIHSYENGVCKNCGLKEAPVFNRDKNRYEITNAAQLYWFAGLVNGDESICTGEILQNTSANAALMNDITVNTGDVAGCNGVKAEDWSEWTSIGIYKKEYTGTFDGQGYAVYGLYQKASSGATSGLFYDIGSGGTVKNVGIVNSYFQIPHVGAVCTYNYGTVSGCYNTGTVIGNMLAGGVCGYNIGTVQNCYNLGTVIGSTWAGGVCGYNSGTVQNCFGAGQVSGTDYVGGVCGDNDGTIHNCFFDCTVYGTTADDSGKTTAVFESGEICYLLTKYGNGDVWGQELGKDTYPTFGSPKVYVSATNCTEYSNTENYAIPHSYNNGFCENCGAKEAAVYNSDKKYYEISNAAQLYWFAKLVNEGVDGLKQNVSAKAVLMNDIIVNTGDVAGCNGVKAEGWLEWTSIGSDELRYKGTFDGQGYAIYGLYQKTDSTEDTTLYCGLFSCIGSKCTVKNLGIVNSYFEIDSASHAYVGGICGYSYEGTIQNCYCTETVIRSECGDSSYGYVGGICAYNSYGTITGCYNTGTISGNDEVGGICGYNDNSTVQNCYNTGTVSNGENPHVTTYIGGVCGLNVRSTIQNCYNTGDVISKQNDGAQHYAGGVCGGLNGSNGRIQFCYNTGTVSEANYVGAVCGSCSSNNTVTDSYFNSDLYSGDGVGYISSTGTVTAVGMTTEMFTNGKVAYLLQQNQTNAVWGQTVGQESLPTLGGKKVLANKNLTVFANDILIYDSGVLLDGTVGMYVDLVADDSYTGWSVSIDSVPTATPAKDENGLYRFTCNVSAKDMERSISFTVADKIDQTFCVSDALSELDKTSDATLGALVEALENYGTAAKAFFGGETVAEQTVTGDMGEADFTVGTLPDGIYYCGSSLLLKSEITVRHYFKLDADKSIADYSFRIGDASAETVPVEKQGYYYIEIQGIRADRLHAEFDLSINDVAGIENFSVLSYVAMVTENADADANLKNLVKALYLYYQNLTAYQNSTTTQNPA